MSRSSTWGRRREDHGEQTPGREESPLGLAGWEGAGRWPHDDTPLLEDVEPELDLWVNIAPGRPAVGI